jgi:membrane-bound metal-dependent hydrolase YbcI (DUF457 family)
MPFTPFHMGPGAAIKAVTGKYFSLSVFGFAQILIDIEPLIRVLQGGSVVHGLSHTFLGATVIGIFSLAVGKPFCSGLFSCWNLLVRPKFLHWLKVSANISWSSAALGAFIGTFSHVLLDSMMHDDIQPFAPFKKANPFLNVLPAGWIYLFCVVFGVFGLYCIVIVSAWRKWSIDL